MSTLKLKLRIYRCLLVTLNIISGLFGVLLLWDSLRLINIQDTYDIFLKTNYSEPASILLGISYLMCVSSIFCCISIHKIPLVSKCMFGSFLVALLVVENLILLYTFIEHSDTLEDVKLRMSKNLDNYKVVPKAHYAWNDVQTELHCCGITRSSDWAFLNVTGGCMVQENGFKYTVPYSCAEMYCHETYKNGCLDTLDNIFSDSFQRIAFELLLIFLLEVATLFPTYVLQKAQDKWNEQNGTHISQERQRLLSRHVDVQQVLASRNIYRNYSSNENDTIVT